MQTLLIVLVPVVFITIPVWVPRLVPWLLSHLLRKRYKQANFLAHLLVEDPEWQLAPGIAMHPSMGFLRMNSGMVELIFWRGHMDWVEEQIVGRALRRAIKQRSTHQLQREVERHAA